MCNVCVCTQMEKSRAAQPTVEAGEEEEEQMLGEKTKAKWSPEEVSGVERLNERIGQSDEDLSGSPPKV